MIMQSMCLASKDWNFCASLGSCINCFTCTVGAAMYISGTVWRFSQSGKVCSGDYLGDQLKKEVTTGVDLNTVIDGYLIQSGKVMFAVLIIFWIFDLRRGPQVRRHA